MKYILITGANGGLASAIIKILLNNGEYVIGLDLKESIHYHENYHGFVCDITKDEDVNNTYEKVCKLTDHIDVIINVAGIVTMGSLIEKDPKVLEKMLEVNVCGMYRINYTFLPLIENGKGRIINFSSEYGKYTTIPFNGFYTITKHAVESYNDGLRRELKYLGIPVSVVRPGAFKTGMQESTYEMFKTLKEETTHYKQTLEKLSPMLDEGNKKTKEPEILAKVVIKGVYAKKPKRVYKCNHNFSVKFLSILPARTVDFVFYKLFK